MQGCVGVAGRCTAPTAAALSFRTGVAATSVTWHQHVVKTPETSNPASHTPGRRKDLNSSIVYISLAKRSVVNKKLPGNSNHGFEPSFWLSSSAPDLGGFGG